MPKTGLQRASLAGTHKHLSSIRMTLFASKECGTRTLPKEGPQQVLRFLFDLSSGQHTSLTQHLLYALAMHLASDSTICRD